MKTSYTLFVVATLVSASAFADPLFPTPVPVPTATTRPPGRPPGQPLPPSGAVDARVRAKLQAYVREKGLRAVTDAQFAAGGLSQEHDFREQSQVINGTRISPFHAGKLNPVNPADRRPNVNVDPGLTTVFRASLTSRLGRPPTDAEIAAEVQAFDNRIAQQNTQMAAAKQEIAARYRQDGEFPRDIERRWMNVSPTDPERANVHAHQAEWAHIVSNLMASSVGADQTTPPPGEPPRPVPRPTFPH